MKTTKLVVALTTVADEAAAGELARALVAERLAACVNRVVIDSTYRWRGSIESGSEVLLIIKSTSDLVTQLRERVHALHTYEVPEFVVLESVAVADAYMAWVREACAPSK